MRDDDVTVTLNFLSDVIGDSAVNVFQDPLTDDCCFELPVFGELGATEANADPLKNDFWPFLRSYEASITAVDMFLFKPHDSSFSDVPLNDNTFGSFFPLGFHSDENGRDYVGYKIDWRKVRDVHGEGIYQIRADKTGIIPNLPSDFEFLGKVDFNLRTYSADRAEGTITITFENSFILKNIYDPRKRVYYPANWGGNIRLNGIFTGNKWAYETTFTKYKDEGLRTVSDRQIPAFRMRVELAPAEVHNFISTEIMQADLIEFIDYNRNNSWGHRSTRVREPSDYEPTDTETELLMDVDVTFKDFYDTGLKKHC